MFAVRNSCCNQTSCIATSKGAGTAHAGQQNLCSSGENADSLALAASGPPDGVAALRAWAVVVALTPAPPLQGGWVELKLLVPAERSLRIYTLFRCLLVHSLHPGVIEATPLLHLEISQCYVHCSCLYDSRASTAGQPCCIVLQSLLCSAVLRFRHHVFSGQPKQNEVKAKAKAKLPKPSEANASKPNSAKSRLTLLLDRCCDAAEVTDLCRKL